MNKNIGTCSGSANKPCHTKDFLFSYQEYAVSVITNAKDKTFPFCKAPFKLLTGFSTMHEAKIYLSKFRYCKKA